MNITVAPTGNIIKGDIFDVSKSVFDRIIRDYDNLLYTKWNPTKNAGYGSWEIRRRPNEKSISTVVEYKGITIAKVDYVESDIIHHVLDVPFLNYAAISKLQSMDTFKYKNVAAWLDAKEHQGRVNTVKANEKEHADAVYKMKQDKKGIAAIREALLTKGFNPNMLGYHWALNDKK